MWEPALGGGHVRLPSSTTATKYRRCPQLHSSFHAWRVCPQGLPQSLLQARPCEPQRVVAAVDTRTRAFDDDKPLLNTRYWHEPIKKQRVSAMNHHSRSSITGALTGIGRAAAVAFAKKGGKVVVAGRRDEAGKALATGELPLSFGSEAEFINADVRKEEDVRALVDKTVARFGRHDVAVNNAGTEGQVGPITEQTAESYAATFDTNVLGVILSMKHEVRVMQGQGKGAVAIINISSTVRLQAAAEAPPSTSAASTPSKASQVDCGARDRQVRNPFRGTPWRLVLRNTSAC